MLVAFSSYADQYKDRYNDGVAFYKSGKYNSAIRHFRSMLKTSRDHDLSDNCQFWIGECYYTMKKYEQALIEFDRTISFPFSNKIEDAMFKIALCHEKLEEPQLALDMYQRFLSNFPASQHTKFIMKRITELGSTQ